MSQPDLNRPLATSAVSSWSSSWWVRLGAVALVIALLGLLVSRLNLRRDMHRLHLSVLSGAPEGNYHGLVESLSGRAAKEGGRLKNIPTTGSAENVSLLAKARGKCDVAIGLAQDGTAWGDPPPGLLGRLPKAESVFWFGKHADEIHEFAQLEHLKIGIGPEGSGAAAIAHQLFALSELAAVGATLSNHPLNEQLEMAAKGELDLALVVMDEDADLVNHALKDLKLEMVGFIHADVIARRIPHLRTGRVGAGEYDAVKLIPKEDKKVLRVETLVLDNGCISRSDLTDVLMLLSRQFPEFVRHNKDTPNATGLELNPTSREFFDTGGPQPADEYAPWLVDVMPPANWAYVVMGISLLFNAMGFGHRFRLWRIDAARVDLESALAALFGPAMTVGDLARAEPTTDPQRQRQILDIIANLEALSARSRRYSLSMLVPMGQEMAYRYQEELIHQTLASLRSLIHRSPQL